MRSYDQPSPKASAALSAFSSAGIPQDLVTKQGELFRHIFLHTLDSMREVTGMTAKSSTEAFETVDTRVQDSVENIRRMLKQLEGSAWLWI